MNTFGMLLLAAATATGQFGGHSDQGLGKPHVGMKRLWRPHAVQHGAPPAGGMIDANAMAAMYGGSAEGGPAGATAGRRFPNVRSQLYFVAPVGMNIGWQTAAGGTGERVYLPAQLVAPARYNFAQGYIYRLKIANIEGRGPLTLYPTIEIAPSTPATDAYLTHNPIPVQFTDEDFDQVQAGNFVTKVIYLPDPKYQELAVAGVETLVSTRLEPGIDPIQEADRRGTILTVIRLGGIDLEMPTQAAAGVPGSAIIDGAPDGAPMLNPTDPAADNVPLDAAPVNPAPADALTPPPTDPTAPAMGADDLNAEPPAPGALDTEAPGDAPDADAPEADGPSLTGVGG